MTNPRKSKLLSSGSTDAAAIAQANAKPVIKPVPAGLVTTAAAVSK